MRGIIYSIETIRFDYLIQTKGLRPNPFAGPEAPGIPRPEEGRYLASGFFCCWPLQHWSIEQHARVREPGTFAVCVGSIVNDLGQSVVFDVR